MVKMRSNQAHPWFLEQLIAGSEFQCSVGEAELLETLGWADRVTAHRQTLRVNRRDMQADQSPVYETKDAQ